MKKERSMDTADNSVESEEGQNWPDVRDVDNEDDRLMSNAMDIEDPEERLSVIEAIKERRQTGFQRRFGSEDTLAADFSKGRDDVDVNKARILLKIASGEIEDDALSQEDAEMVDSAKRFTARRRWQAAIGVVKQEVELENQIDSWNRAVLHRWVSLYHTSDMDDEATHTPYLTMGFVTLQVVFFFVYAFMANVSVSAASPAVGPEIMFFEIVSVGPCYVTCVDGRYEYEIREYTDQRHEVWRYFTYPLCHIGYSHLAVNVIVEILLGVPLESFHGPWRMAQVGLLSILGAAVTISWQDPYLQILGSSGYGYGLLGVHFGNLLLNWKELRKSTHLPPIPNNVYRLVGLCILGVALNATYIVAKMNGESDGTSHSGHFGGFVSGLFFSVPILRTAGRHNFHRPLVSGCTALGIAYLLWGVAWTAVFWRPIWLLKTSLSWDPLRDWCSVDGTVGEEFGETC
uniref:Peptidase S54 rhomboid domain-containing protein n=2 Tax=Phaeomonas parva TaxID=124430 RepID=A0A6U4K681_9STRA|mmetsp:Transcript_43539/g.136573  ORF Transcript_43539/g.136573 Transcript_43539/m.136573 type:complete len:459 (+) Transcript_43539:195-1571(+)